MEAQNNAQVVKTADWVITFLIAFIPLVGFVMLFIWAFGGRANPNKANLAKAALIWTVIGFLAMFLFRFDILAAFCR